jgi:hypothetical protein
VEFQGFCAHKGNKSTKKSPLTPKGETPFF